MRGGHGSKLWRSSEVGLVVVGAEVDDEDGKSDGVDSLLGVEEEEEEVSASASASASAGSGREALSSSSSSGGIHPCGRRRWVSPSLFFFSIFITVTMSATTSTNDPAKH